MSQNDFTLANQSFPAFRADLNSALQALASNNSGATAPSTTFANMWWYDSSNNIMYIRNEDNDAWIKFAELDQANDKFVLSGTLQLDDGTVSAPALTFNSDTNMGIYRGGTDILKFVTAGTDAITINASQNTTFGSGSDTTLSIDSSSAFDASLTTDGTNQALNIIGTNNSSNGNVYIKTGGTGTPLTRARFEPDGDISFYEDTGTTPKFFWDSSAEALGIGTSSPISALDLSGGADGTPQTITLAQGNASSKASSIVGTYSSTNEQGINFVTNNFGQSTAMSLTASGNLLVGKISTGLSVTGTQITSDGRAMFTRDGNQAADFNRKTSDGDIVKFHKDSTLVGSIGVSSSDNLYIAGSVASHAGITFGTNQIIPLSSGGSGDNTVDLGNNGNYFKDLLVKGGVRFGTNTSANYLDDYEEGSYTVGIFDAGSGGNQSPTTTTGYYTKIGDMVFFSFNITGIDITGLTSGNNASFSLPFTSSSTQNKNFCALVHVLASDVNWAGSQTQLSSFVGTSTSRFQFWVSGDNIAVATVKVSEISSADFYVSGQFRV